MKRERQRRIGLILLVLVLLTVSICTTFAMAVHAGCCAAECAPCLNLAKLQGTLRQLDGALGALVGLLAMLTFLLIVLGELLCNGQASNLVALKMRLNN